MCVLVLLIEKSLQALLKVASQYCSLYFQLTQLPQYVIEYYPPIHHLLHWLLAVIEPFSLCYSWLVVVVVVVVVLKRFFLDLLPLSFIHYFLIIGLISISINNFQAYFFFNRFFLLVVVFCSD